MNSAPAASRTAWIAVGVVGVVSLAVIAWALWPQPEGPADSRFMEDGGVTATATRLSSDPVTFSLVLETHTVDLSGYDPVAQAFLETSDGQLQATEASRVIKNDGHHIEARLVFDADEGDVLVLQDLAGRDWRLVF